MSGKTKRDVYEGDSSKRPKLANYYNTLRFKPLKGKEDAAIFSKYLVQFYIQQFGQNFFMEELDNGHIDVRFVDSESALNVVKGVTNAPFSVHPRTSIKLDAIQKISPGVVTLYQPPRDVGHYDGTPLLPRGWNNPFPINFRPPLPDPNKPPPQRAPRYVPTYPEPALAPASPPDPPFEQPQWPPLPDRFGPE